MPITLGSNIAALKALRELGRGADVLLRTFERLSSGQRINHALDDPAGLAISSSLHADARVFGQAIRNVNDAVSMINVATGALTELSAISQRHLELAEQAANGVYSSVQRRALDLEANALVDEYNRIVQSTSFNGVRLFDPNNGTIAVQAGYGSASVLNLSFVDKLARTTGDGTFANAISLAAGGTTPRKVEVADLNGDGKLDLVSADAGSDKASVYIGNGNGTFLAPRTYATAGFVPVTLALADFNNDGRPDMVTGEFTTTNISVFQPP